MGKGAYTHLLHEYSNEKKALKKVLPLCVKISNPICYVCLIAVEFRFDTCAP